MKKLLCFLTLLFLSSYLLIPLSARAIAEVQAEQYSVTSEVPSPVSAEKSVVVVNPAKSSAETTASESVAGSGQKIVVTVTLYDGNNLPLAGKTVELRSNRGDIDEIYPIPSQNPVSLADVKQVVLGENSATKNARTNTTDKFGIALFSVKSDIAGVATFTVIADNIIQLDKTITINFLPPPFPSRVEIEIPLPGGKSFTLFQSKEILSGTNISENLVNTATKIVVPSWLFLLAMIIILGVPLFIFLNFLNLRRMRWLEREQSLLLKKMFPPNYNRQS